ncbi:hypothetical protein ml_107 [Mollivirus sibericum]|uniref:hypothetical protein n=1 Tax=Mollivirus sibericum TaxID=1678078 RepID=UPI0006B2E01C|nr:hypothetical protein ml_107 [Mollivirus sibericum]ALD61909.1 hypothetical protein ml_107 [Mollivirus sibericum]
MSLLEDKLARLSRHIYAECCYESKRCRFSHRKPGRWLYERTRPVSDVLFSLAREVYMPYFTLGLIYQINSSISQQGGDSLAREFSNWQAMVIPFWFAKEIWINLLVAAVAIGYHNCAPKAFLVALDLCGLVIIAWHYLRVWNGTHARNRTSLLRLVDAARRTRKENEAV